MTGKVSLSQVPVYPHFLTSDAEQVDRNKRVALDEKRANTTSSLEDENFVDYRESQKLTTKQVKELKDFQLLLRKSKLSIEQHLERRVSQLFMQAVVCHRTGYRFRIGQTLHQGRHAETLKYGSKKNEKVLFDAAHPATIPNLYAKSPDSDVEIVYLYRSGFYDESNATIDILKRVNQADIAIDGKGDDGLLRSQVVKLLNTCAEDEISPEQVAQEFVKKLMTVIEKAINDKENVEIKEVLKLYQDKAELLWSYVNDHPDHFDRWLNLDMDDPMLVETSTIVQLIHDGYCLEKGPVRELIRKKIEDLPVAILRERHEKSNEIRPPTHFDPLFKRQILQHFEGKNLRFVEKALNITLDDLKKECDYFTYKKTTELLLKEHEDKIEQLVKEVETLIDSTREDTIIPLDAVKGLDPQKKVVLRPDIYRLRHKMIRKDQETQSVIKSKIESVWNAINTSGAHLRLFFDHALLERCDDPILRSMLCKLLPVSPTRLHQSIRELRVNQNAHKALENLGTRVSALAGRIQKASKSALKKSQKEDFKREILSLFGRICDETSQTSSDHIQLLFYRRLFDGIELDSGVQLLRDLLETTPKRLDREIEDISREPAVEATMRSGEARRQLNDILTVASDAIAKLREQTVFFQSDLIIQLRKSYGMSQEVLAGVYNDKFDPKKDLKRQVVSNLENAVTPVNRKRIERFSKIFGVSPTLFYPSHFATS